MSNVAMWLSYAALQGVLRASSKNAYNSPAKGIIVYTLDVPVELDSVRDYILEEHSAASAAGARELVEKVVAIGRQRIASSEDVFPKIYFAVSPKNLEDPYVVELFQELGRNRSSNIITIICES